jgi:hypothetical protein
MQFACSLRATKPDKNYFSTFEGSCHPMNPALEMTRSGKHGKPKYGFPPFPFFLEIPSGFPHSQRYGGGDILI